MNVSLRSQMAAGVAVMGAAAVAVAPIVQPDLLSSPQRVAAAVELSALVNPLAVLGETIGGINYFILSQEFVPNDLIWPDDFYGVEFLYAPLNIGIVPDLVNQLSTGPLSGLVNNLSGYLYAVGEGVLNLGVGASDSVFNTPAALVTAAGELIGGDPEAALNTLVTQIVGPLQAGIDVALSAVGYVLDNVIENIQTVITSTLPFVASGVVNAVVGGLTYLVNSVVTTAGQVIADLGAGQFEAAWNDAINGFLGADGTLGDVVRLGLGLGIVEDVEGVNTVTIPSLRSVLTSELQRLGGQKFFEDGGITNDPFDPFGTTVAETAAAATVPAPAAAVQSVPAAVSDDAPTAPKTAVTESLSVEVPVEIEEPGGAAESDATTEAAVEVSQPEVKNEGVAAAVEAVEAPSSAPSGAAARNSAQAGVSERATVGTPKRSAPRMSKKAASSGRLAN